MKFNIKEYEEHTNDLIKLNQEAKEQQNKFYSIKREIEDKFWKLEQNLRETKREELNEAEAKEKAEAERIKAEKEKHTPHTQELKYILNLLDLKEKKDDLNDFKVYYFEDHKEVDYKEVEVLEANDFLNLKVYVTKNDKPKNKYSLIIVGKSFFMDWRGEGNILKIKPREYGVRALTKNDNISALIKDFETEKDALNYYNKNKDKVLKEFREEHKKVVEDFKEVLQNCNTKEWEILTLNHKKEYFENGYSGYYDNEEYKKIVERLNNLGGL